MVNGVTKADLSRYVTIRTGIIPEDVNVVPFRVITIRRLGTALLSMDLRPDATCFKFSLSQLGNEPTPDECKAYAARVVKHCIALEDSCVRASVTSVRNAFKAHGKTAFQFDQQVIGVHGRYVKVYKEPRYTKLHENEDWKKFGEGVPAEWLESFLRCTYPKDIV